MGESSAAAAAAGSSGRSHSASAGQADPRTQSQPHHASSLSSLSAPAAAAAAAVAGSTAPSTAHGQDRPRFPLLAIFFAEFDNTLGPKITCQSPAGFLSDDTFDSIADFLITGPELCHKLVTVSVGARTIIGYPMLLHHKKYHRNTLLFNIAFVFPREESNHKQQARGGAQDTTTNAAGSAAAASAAPSSSSSLPSATSIQLRPYHPVIRKLATIIESLEVESEFLFRPESKRFLQGLIHTIFRELNEYGECSVLLETKGKDRMQEIVSAAAATATAAAMAAAATAAAAAAAGGSAAAMATPAASSSSAAAAESSALPSSLFDASAPTSLCASSSVAAPSTVASSAVSSALAALDGVNKINLKLYPLLAFPPRHIPPFLVPLPVKPLEVLWKSEWDLTLRQVIPFMDGVNYVSKIALLSGIHLSLVTKCVRQLLYYQAIQVVDIFQFSNRYANTEALATKCRGGGGASRDRGAPDTEAEDVSQRARALRNDMRSVARLDPSRPRPPFHVLFRILCALNPHVTLSDVFRNLDALLPEFAAAGSAAADGQNSDGSAGAVAPVTLESLNIHPRKLIQFATINGLLRRVYQYPILVGHLLGGQSLAATHDPKQTGGSQLGASTVGGVDLSFFGLLHGRQHLLEDALARQLAMQAARAASRAAAAAAAMAPLNIGGATAEASADTKGMFRANATISNHAHAAATTAGDSDAVAAAAAAEAAAVATVAGVGNKHPQGSPQSAHSGSIVPSSSSSVPQAPALVPASASAFAASFRQLERYLDGEHHTDELCCMFGRSFAQIEEEIRRSKKCIMINK